MTEPDFAGSEESVAARPEPPITNNPAPALAATTSNSGLPQGVVRPGRDTWLSPAWLIPFLALVLLGSLAYRAWQERGIPIQIRFRNGHGIKPGDQVVFRGIVVGEVAQVELTPPLNGVEVAVALRRQAVGLARQGARFWIVRPQIGFGGVEGLETVLGAKYITLLPGDGPFLGEFIGLEEPPILEGEAADCLEVILQALERGTLRPGLPVTYRQVRIGSILSVGLSSDASAVEARALIRKPYANLIREQSQFWLQTSLQVQASLTGGFQLEMQSAEQFLFGAVAVATPPMPGEPVYTGHRFVLTETAPAESADWRPQLGIGNTHLPPGTPLPELIRAALTWRRSGIFVWDRTPNRRAWLIPTPQGVLGPTPLLTVPPTSQPNSAYLAYSGQTCLLTRPATDAPVPLMLVPYGSSETEVVEAGSEAQAEAAPPTEATTGRETTAPAAPLAPCQFRAEQFPNPARLRIVDKPEPGILVGDSKAETPYLAEARFTALAPGRYRLDPAIALGSDWHGAAFVAERDGAVIGILLTEDVPAPELILWTSELAQRLQAEIATSEAKKSDDSNATRP